MSETPIGDAELTIGGRTYRARDVLILSAGDDLPASLTEALAEVNVVVGVDMALTDSVATAIYSLADRIINVVEFPRDRELFDLRDLPRERRRADPAPEPWQMPVMKEWHGEFARRWALARSSPPPKFSSYQGAF